ncbi:efflux RND transporter periplasmic adaptor subunit [Tundrisphaera sp. TA3]|uniref:efflux RND transporter periplasmic adaptor subunit n=1 Tax=Tundrisphaera sp. TA3 TaxID=3435775 RepID=UPI003EBBABD4
MATEGAGSRWARARMVIKVVELRLRFIVLMGATGLGFAYWDTLANRYDKWMRPKATGAVAAVSGIEYFCPMHPAVIRDEPGSCPACGMPLAKRQKGEKAPLAAGVLARVQLAPHRIHQAGIRTAEVAYEPITETFSTVGTVEYDERKVRQIASKVRGMARVEKLHVDFTGVEVAAGAPMAELYGAELYQGVRELLLAHQRAKAPAARSLLGEGNDLEKLAADKLGLMGVTAEQIRAIVRDGKADFTLPILAPIGGHVVRKDVVEGQYVSEGQSLFEVADLSTVWVKARVYEDQVGLVRVGQAVEATVPAYPGSVFAGKVAFIQPHLDPATRTVEVRYDLDNADHRLLPGFFATVTLRTPIAETPMFRGRIAKAGGDGPEAMTVASQKICPVTNAALGSMGKPIPTEVEGRTIWTCCGSCPPQIKAKPAKFLARLAPPPRDGVLSVPESAVIDTGTLRMVYVEAEPGVYEGRKVVLGPRSGDRFPVLEGLQPGETVVAAGAFLVDAESRLDPSTRPETNPTPADRSPETNPTPAAPADDHQHHRPAPRVAAEATSGRVNR